MLEFLHPQYNGHLADITLVDHLHQIILIELQTKLKSH